MKIFTQQVDFELPDPPDPGRIPLTYGIGGPSLEVMIATLGTQNFHFLGLTTHIFRVSNLHFYGFEALRIPKVISRLVYFTYLRDASKLLKTGLKKPFSKYHALPNSNLPPKKSTIYI